MKKLFLFISMFLTTTIFLFAQDKIFEDDYRIFFNDRVIDIRDLSVTKIVTKNFGENIISFHKDYIALYAYKVKKLWVIDSQTLKEQWEIDLTKNIYNIKTDENYIYCMGENSIISINRKSGTIENEYILLKDNSYVRDIDLNSYVIVILTSNHKLIFLNKSDFKEIKGISFDTKQYSNFYSNMLHLGKKDNFLVCLNLETEFHIICFDERAKILWEKQITHTHIEKEGNVHYYKPYLNIIQSDERYILFSTNYFYREFEKTIILDSFTGYIISDLNINTVSFLNKDDKIVSLFKLEGKDSNNMSISMLDPTTGKQLWKTKFFAYADTLTPLLYGNKLVLALYCQISTGSSLICLDYTNGKFSWKADVDQLFVSHSKYFNNVYLKRYKDKVAMLGNESYGDYIQVFLIEDGRKIFSDIKQFGY